MRTSPGTEGARGDSFLRKGWWINIGRAVHECGRNQYAAFEKGAVLCKDSNGSVALRGTCEIGMLQSQELSHWVGNLLKRVVGCIEDLEQYTRANAVWKQSQQIVGNIQDS